MSAVQSAQRRLSTDAQLRLLGSLRERTLLSDRTALLEELEAAHWQCGAAAAALLGRSFCAAALAVAAAATAPRQLCSALRHKRTDDGHPDLRSTRSHYSERSNSGSVGLPPPLRPTGDTPSSAPRRVSIGGSTMGSHRHGPECTPLRVDPVSDLLVPRHATLDLPGSGAPRCLADFEVGMRVMHEYRGAGTVESVNGTAVCVTFDTGDRHAYQARSLNDGRLQRYGTEMMSSPAPHHCSADQQTQSSVRTQKQNATRRASVGWHAVLTSVYADSEAGDRDISGRELEASMALPPAGAVCQNTQRSGSCASRRHSEHVPLHHRLDSVAWRNTLMRLGSDCLRGNFITECDIATTPPASVRGRQQHADHHSEGPRRGPQTPASHRLPPPLAPERKAQSMVSRLRALLVKAAEGPEGARLFQNFPPDEQFSCLQRAGIDTVRELEQRIAHGSLNVDLKEKGPQWYTREQVVAIARCLRPAADVRQPLLVVGWERRALFARHSLDELVELLERVGVATSLSLLKALRADPSALRNTEGKVLFRPIVVPDLIAELQREHGTHAAVASAAVCVGRLFQLLEKAASKAAPELFAAFPPKEQLLALQQIGTASVEDLADHIMKGDLNTELKEKGPSWYTNDQVKAVVAAMYPAVDVRRALLTVGWAKRAVFARHSLEQLLAALSESDVQSSAQLYEVLKSDPRQIQRGGKPVFRPLVADALIQFLETDRESCKMTSFRFGAPGSPGGLSASGNVSPCRASTYRQQAATGTERPLAGVVAAAVAADPAAFATFDAADQLQCLKAIGVESSAELQRRIISGQLNTDLKEKGPSWYTAAQVKGLCAALYPATDVRRGLLTVGWAKRALFARAGLEEVAAALEECDVRSSVTLLRALRSDPAALVRGGKALFRPAVVAALITFLEEDARTGSPERRRSVAGAQGSPSSTAAARRFQSMRAPSMRPVSASSLAAVVYSAAEAAPAVFESFPPAEQLRCLQRIDIDTPEELSTRIAAGRLNVDLKEKGPSWYTAEQALALIAVLHPAVDVRRPLLSAAWGTRTVLRGGLERAVTALSACGVDSSLSLRRALESGQPLLGLNGKPVFAPAAVAALAAYFRSPQEAASPQPTGPRPARRRASLPAHPAAAAAAAPRPAPAPSVPQSAPTSVTGTPPQPSLELVSRTPLQHSLPPPAPTPQQHSLAPTVPTPQQHSLPPPSLTPQQHGLHTPAQTPQQSSIPARSAAPPDTTPGAGTTPGAPPASSPMPHAASPSPPPSPPPQQLQCGGAVERPHSPTAGTRLHVASAAGALQGVDAVTLFPELARYAAALGAAAPRTIPIGLPRRRMPARSGEAAEAAQRRRDGLQRYRKAAGGGPDSGPSGGTARAGASPAADPEAAPAPAAGDTAGPGDSAAGEDAAPPPPAPPHSAEPAAAESPQRVTAAECPAPATGPGAAAAHHAHRAPAQGAPLVSPSALGTDGQVWRDAAVLAPFRQPPPPLLGQQQPAAVVPDAAAEELLTKLSGCRRLSPPRRSPPRRAAAAAEAAGRALAVEHSADGGVGPPPSPGLDTVDDGSAVAFARLEAKLEVLEARLRAEQGPLADPAPAGAPHRPGSPRRGSSPYRQQGSVQYSPYRSLQRHWAPAAPRTASPWR